MRTMQVMALKTVAISEAQQLQMDLMSKEGYKFVVCLFDEKSKMIKTEGWHHSILPAIRQRSTRAGAFVACLKEKE